MKHAQIKINKNTYMHAYIHIFMHKYIDIYLHTYTHIGLHTYILHTYILHTCILQTHIYYRFQLSKIYIVYIQNKIPNYNTLHSLLSRAVYNRHIHALCQHKHHV